jgi:hypothetical protein
LPSIFAPQVQSRKLILILFEDCLSVTGSFLKLDPQVATKFKGTIGPTANFTRIPLFVRKINSFRRLRTNLVVTRNVRDYVSDQQPCCGGCRIGVQKMHLYYWPELITSSDDKSTLDLHVNSFGPSRKPFVPTSYVDENEFTLLVLPT